MRGVCVGVTTRPALAALRSPFILRRKATALQPTCSSSDHISFISHVAAAQPPQNLHTLIKILQGRGETIVSPCARQGLISLAIPLSRNHSGTLVALLRWPTPPAGMEMPVVEVHQHGVWLLAKSVDQYIHRILVEEDACHSANIDGKPYSVLNDSANNIYKRGDFAMSRISNLDIYLLKMVGLFPDVMERKALGHLEKGDQVSALVSGEFYAKKEHFPGFGRPFVFNAEVLLKVGRNLEAKDAARVALKSPWWTLGCKYEHVAEIAQWEDEQIEYIRERVTEEGRREDLKKGKAPAQVALDQAAFLMDLASVDGTWLEIEDQVADCYEEAGLPEIARFILHKG
ncbi:hypothetical protein AMTR_s00051p00066360 [Amborella trichopoda]|uniref:Uncharacterized protein n=2 Tax=Amborella trichopoda TaxID=13333 RepID=U5D324_AMBTC|nr:hypothetical protein AMTR_s00051p00066360 [Amborella trichopoda]